MRALNNDGLEGPPLRGEELDQLAPNPLPPQAAEQAHGPGTLRTGEYSDLVRRLFQRPSAVSITSSGADSLHLGICEGIAAELAKTGKQVVVVPVDRLLLMNPVRVIDDLSLLPGVSPNVWVWPSIAQQVEVFGAGSIGEGEDWLERLRRNFHTVLLDCPPLEAMPGVAEISAMVDATLLVVQAGRSTRQQIRKDQLALQLSGATVAGCILIGAK